MEINARGLSCPQPVILTKKAIEQNPNDITVLVDEGAPKENVSRFLTNSGYKVIIKEDEEGFILQGRK